MNFNTEEFDFLNEKLSKKDLEIAELRREVAQLTEERDLWMTRALTADEPKASEGRSPRRFIVISVKKLKAVLAKIHDVKILSVIAFILQKALSREDSAEDCKLVMDIVPMPQQPSVTLKADGDVNVEGNWNDVHDNGEVNF